MVLTLSQPDSCHGAMGKFSIQENSCLYLTLWHSAVRGGRNPAIQKTNRMYKLANDDVGIFSTDRPSLQRDAEEWLLQLIR